MDYITSKDTQAADLYQIQYSNDQSFQRKYVEDIRSKTQFTIDYMTRHGKYDAPSAFCMDM